MPTPTESEVPIYTALDVVKLLGSDPSFRPCGFQAQMVKDWLDELVRERELDAITK